MEKLDSNFRARVYVIVAQIPRGRVMTYGQIAALCGSPRAARIVGGIAHQAPCASIESTKSISRVSGFAREHANAFCPSCDIPWQRVVKKDGLLAEGYPGGVSGHKAALEIDGVEVSDDFKVDIDELIWKTQ